MAQDNQNCIFCEILRGQAPSETIYEDDDVMCIKDINPASAHHYLIIPKVHIENAKVLKPEDEHVLEKMLETVKLVSDRHRLDPASTRTGFHWPPFTTVRHLHLHLISPVEDMNFIKRIMFKPNSFWFVSTEYVQSRFRSQGTTPPP